MIDCCFQFGFRQFDRLGMGSSIEGEGEKKRWAHLGVSGVSIDRAWVRGLGTTTDEARWSADWAYELEDADAICPPLVVKRPVAAN